MKFPPDKIQVASPTTGSSFISVWVAQPEYSNIDGTISFKGGVPSPGINTSSGLVSTIIFRVKAPGQAKITFLDSSNVLLADGKGTGILTSVIEANYTFLIPLPEGPEVYSPTHPDQNFWYRDNNPVFTWARGGEVTGFSYVLDQDPRGIPDSISEGLDISKSYTDIFDGIWYFHIKAKTVSWGKISHLPVNIDVDSPASFDLKIEPSDHTMEQRPTILFVTTDTASGIDHYELQIINISDPQKSTKIPFFVEVSSPYRVPKLEPGIYDIVVRAYDKAGNWQESTSKIEIIGPPVGQKRGLKDIILDKAVYILLVILIIFLAVGGFYYFKNKKKQQRLRKEFAEVKKSLGTSFGALKDDIKEELEELEKLGAEQELTKEEKARRKELLDNLKVAEEFIEKEVKDVEEELK